MKTKIKLSAVKQAILALSIVACMVNLVILIVYGFSTKKVEDHSLDEIFSASSVSWAHSYQSIGELEKSSDFIGLIEIIGVTRTNEIIPNGVTQQNENRNVIPLTIFSARVLDGVISDSNTIEIVMTGKAGEINLDTDPLMSSNEKWFIFARKNYDGSYTILGGPQGRFIYNESNDTISSLNSLLYGREEMTNLSLSETKAEISKLRKQN
ncbi:MAG: hypothetical protein FWC09_06805 [Lachnospiraceae bacterium]|nr:hypothetical protein [Lachnospiraceae bacterium]